MGTEMRGGIFVNTIREIIEDKNNMMDIREREYKRPIIELYLKYGIIQYQKRGEDHEGI